jgi:aspartate/methionine/tyrosine aminotransferase
MAVQLAIGAGDEVIVPSPAWPNLEGAVISRGGRVRHVPMQLGPKGWTLDLDRLFAAATAQTRAIFINSPSNPTGWTASLDDLRSILAFARARGLWIIADEIYGRFYFAGGAGALAPSFQTLREPGDRILFVQTFSKNWAMTGWRLGWLQAPAELGQTIENLIQYNTSGVAPFMQRAGVAALEHGEAFAQSQIARAAEGRQILEAALKPFNTVRFSPPAGAFYQFFAIDGLKDSTAAALRLVDEANIGLAPGAAFGPGGEGHFRICFLRSPQGLTTAMERLATWLRARG